jgi:cysteine desulfurase
VLTLTSEYALRIMAFLAQQPADALVPAIAMNGKVKVPANYRGKILNQLTRAGLLASTRGRTGGFRLARPAARIRLIEVVAPFEPVTGARTCVLGRARCQESQPCGAHDRWRLLSQAREEFLRGTTVADVAA